MGSRSEEAIQGTSHGVQTRVEGCEQPEPSHFHIPVQSDLETKRVAFRAGHRSGGGAVEVIQQSVNSEEG